MYVLLGDSYLFQSISSTNLASITQKCVSFVGLHSTLAYDLEILRVCKMKFYGTRRHRPYWHTCITSYSFCCKINLVEQIVDSILHVRKLNLRQLTWIILVFMYVGFKSVFRHGMYEIGYKPSALRNHS